MHRFIALTRKATRPVGLPSLVRPVSPLASLRPLSTAVSHASPVPWRDRPITALLRDERARIADDSFAQYQLHLHPQPAHPPPATREDLVDSLVGALAIEAAATEEILFPVIQDLVGEKKTWEEDRVVSSNGTVAGKHVNNVFESWVEQHQRLKELLEKVHALRIAGDHADLDRGVRELIGHVAALTSFESNQIHPLLEAHFNPDQLKYMSNDYHSARLRVPHQPHANLPKWLYEHPTLEKAMHRVLRIWDEVAERTGKS